MYFQFRCLLCQSRNATDEYKVNRGSEPAEEEYATDLRETPMQEHPRTLRVHCAPPRVRLWFPQANVHLPRNCDCSPTNNEQSKLRDGWGPGGSLGSPLA